MIMNKYQIRLTSQNENWEIFFSIDKLKENTKDEYEIIISWLKDSTFNWMSIDEISKEVESFTWEDYEIIGHLKMKSNEQLWMDLDSLEWNNEQEQDNEIIWSLEERYIWIVERYLNKLKSFSDYADSLIYEFSNNSSILNMRNNLSRKWKEMNEVLNSIIWNFWKDEINIVWSSIIYTSFKNKKSRKKIEKLNKDINKLLDNSTDKNTDWIDKFFENCVIVYWILQIYDDIKNWKSQKDIYFKSDWFWTWSFYYALYEEKKYFDKKIWDQYITFKMVDPYLAEKQDLDINWTIMIWKVRNDKRTIREKLQDFFALKA